MLLRFCHHYSIPDSGFDSEGARVDRAPSGKHSLFSAQVQLIGQTYVALVVDFA